MELEKALKPLMFSNGASHFGSAVFAGIWIADMLAPDGAMSTLDWLKTGTSVLALAGGLTFSSYLALRYLPKLPEKIQSKAKVSFICIYAVVGCVLATASASVLASVSGNRAHMEHTADRYRDALEAQRRAAAKIINRAPALNECHIVARNMSGEEVTSGSYSESGRNVGRVAITLRNVATGCEVALRAIYASRATLARRFDRAERLLIEIRQVIDGEETEATKVTIVRKKMDDLQRVLRAANDAFPVEAMQAAAAATSKDWFNIGLPETAAIALTGNFAGLADSVTEGLDDVADLKNRKLPRMTVVPDMAYLALYPQATIGALVIGLIIELIPLGTILIGFALSASRPLQNGSIQETTERVPARRGRPPEKQIAAQRHGHEVNND